MIKAKLIIYTDGSTRGNPGPSGSGIHSVLAIDDGKVIGVAGKYNITSHGYILRTSLKSDKLIKEELKALNTFPSDYEENKNIRPLRMGPVTDIVYSNHMSRTNNQAELDAVSFALENITSLIPDGYEVTDVLVVSDSTYVLGAMKKVMLDILDLSSVEKNIEYITRLKEAIEDIGVKFSLSVGKIKAHDGIGIGNEKADALANMGSIKRSSYKPLEDIVEIIKVDKDYWKDPVFNTDLWYFKQVFNFYPDTSVQNRTYFGLNYKKNSDMGKKISGVTYTILKLNESNHIIDMLLNIMRDTLGSTYYPYILLIDNIVNKNVLRDLLRYGKDFLYVKMGAVVTIKTMSGVDVAQVMTPAGMSIAVMDKVGKLDIELDDYLDGKISDKSNVFDITDLIYTVDSKGNNIIKKEILNDKFVLKFKYEHPEYRAVTIRLRPKLDMPIRNKLKRYEKLHPTVTLLVTHIGHIIEYKTIIKLDTGDVIYSNNVYANKMVMKPKMR